MWIANEWEDYELLDAGGGEKLERWGPYVLRRPDPQAVWPPSKAAGEWASADAAYSRSASGGGSWGFARELPDTWEIRYKGLRFCIKPMQFKHTGIFPEQAVNWDWMAKLIGGQSQVKLLNLFAYTGAATVAAARAGAHVCHVDAARGIVAMAKANASLSGVPEGRARYIVDDVFKFVRREIRRGSVYDAVIMDPPAYGRGPGGELWKAGDHLYGAVELCAQLFMEPPLFFIINSYAAGLSAATVENVLRIAMGRRFGGVGHVESGEIGIPVSSGGAVLPCGCCARWARV